jgi:hypothetical protein
MKTQLFALLKIKPLLFSYLTLFFLIIKVGQCYAQYIQPLGNNGDVGTLKVTSSGGSVAGNNTYFGSVPFGESHPNLVEFNGGVVNAFNAIGPSFRLKANAGKQVNISIEFDLLQNESTQIVATQLNGVYSNFTDQSNPIDRPSVSFALNTPLSNAPNKYRFDGSVTFSGASEVHFVIIGFELKRSTYTQKYGIVLPFMVDGIVKPAVNLVMANPTTPRVITQPMLPITVLHAPPGDQSFCTYEASKTVCQTTETNISQGLSNSGNASVKLGFKGSIGFVATIDIEAYVELTGSGTEGNSTVRIKNNETCITSTNAFGVNAGLGEDVFLCAGQDFNYGIYEELNFDPPSNYSPVFKRGLVLVEAGPERLNLYTQSNILEQIETLKQDTLNTSLALKIRIEAKNQIKIWKQIIAINDANTANAGIMNPSFIDPINFPGGTFRDRITSVNTSQTNTLVVDNYVEGNVGIQGVVNIGGSGFSAGYNMQTTKSYGQTSSATNSNSTTISIHMQDDDADPDAAGPQVGDIFNVNFLKNLK